MKVRELMTSEVQTCEPDDDLGRAAQIMWDFDCGIVPIVESDGSVVGVVTDRDACMAAWSQGRPLAALRVRDTMTPGVLTCGPEDELAAAMSVMRQGRVRRLPVLDARGALIGILSLNDIAIESERQQERGGRKIPASELAATLAAVCAPRKSGRSEPEPALPRATRSEREGIPVAIGTVGRGETGAPRNA